MIYKFLLAVCLTSLGSVGALAQPAASQEPPKCYIINESGELTDLTDICDVSLKQSPEADSTNSSEAQNVNQNVNLAGSKSGETEVSLSDSVYILGETSLAQEPGAIDSTYYIENAIGSDYAAYIRSYQAPGTSFDRQTLRQEAFQLNTQPSQTAILRQGTARTPFLIYRYQK